MSFTSIINNFNKLKLTGDGENFAGKVSDNAPLSTLISPILQWYNQLKAKLPQYDCLASALSSCDSVAEYYADKASDNETVNLNDHTDTIISITEDEGEAIITACSQVLNNLGSGDRIMVTSTSGLVYSLGLLEEPHGVSCINAFKELIPVVWKQDDHWYMRVFWPSVASDLSPEDAQESAGYSINQLSIENASVATGGKVQAITIASRIINFAKKVSGDDSISTIAEATEVLHDEYGTTGETIFDVQDEINEELTHPGEIVVNGSDHYLLIVDGLVQSGTINDVICSSIEAMQANTLGSYLDNANEQYVGAKDGLKLLLRRLSTAYKTGGLRGFILCLIRLIKGQASVVDENGYFKFTDNNAMIPREFIVGIIGGVASTVFSVASMVVAAVYPIVGVLASTIGQLAWSLIGSIKSTHDDTYSSAAVPVDSYEEISMVPYSPISLLQGTCSITDRAFSWYREFYATTNACALLQVPGGALFVGPGGFGDQGEVTVARYEFHPFANIVEPIGWINFQAMMEQVTVDAGDVPASESYAFRILHPDYIFGSWWRIMHDPGYNTRPLNNDGSGKMSSQDSNSQCASTIACVGVFVYWLLMVRYYDSLMENPNINDDSRIITCFDKKTDYDVISGSSQRRLRFNSNNGLSWTMAALAALALTECADYDLEDHIKSITRVSNSDSLVNWKNIISCCSSVNAETGDNFTCYVCNRSASLVVWEIVSSLSFDKNPSFFAEVCNELYHSNDFYNPDTKKFSWNIGDPVLLPERPVYAVTPPGINKSTYWMWAVLAIAVTTAVTITAVVGSVKFNKWRKGKRFENTIRAQSARDTASDALNGMREEVDPSTGEIVKKSFDVNSPEGQEYINSCVKDYKKTCFKSNLWSHLIGGSRYDYTSFYGDAADDDSSVGSDSNARLSEIIYGGDNDVTSVDALSNPESNLSVIKKLIVGDLEANSR